MPILMIAASRLQAYRLLVRHDDSQFLPGATDVDLAGGVFDGAAHAFNFNLVATVRAPGLLAVAFTADLFHDRAAPAGTDILVGTLVGSIAHNFVPGER